MSVPADQVTEEEEVALPELLTVIEAWNEIAIQRQPNGQPGRGAAQLENFLLREPSAVKFMMPERTSRQTLLMQALFFYQLEHMRILLRHGADPNQASSDGNTPLGLQVLCFMGTYFAELTSKTGLAILLEAGADPNKLAKGMTPLHLSVVHDHFEAATTLLMYGAQLNLKDANGLLPHEIDDLDAKEGDYCALFREFSKQKLL